MNKYDNMTRTIIEQFLNNFLGDTGDDKAILISLWLLDNFSIIRKNKYVIKQ